MSDLTIAGVSTEEVALATDTLGAQKLERRLFIALAGGVLLLVSLISRWLGQHEQIAQIPAFLGATILVIPLFLGAWKEVFTTGRPSSDTLACLAVFGAIAIEYYLAAGFLALILWTANLTLSRTAWGAQRAIRGLVELTPDIARLLVEDVEQEVPLSKVKVGDVVRVRPGENLPVDGKIVHGSSNINQASLTGEAVPVSATIGTDVYAGTSNLTSQIDINVTAVAGDTTIGKVEELIREAESAKTQRQALIEQLASYYVYVVLMVAVLVWFFTSKGDESVRNEAMVRAITALVVTCPGALLISYPTAMVMAFATAARLGIMIKQTKTLEAAADIDTVILDKTGTLTTGVFAVSKLAPAQGVEGAALLQAAADGEQHSNHPLAKSILETAIQARIKPCKVNNFEEAQGRGVIAEIEGGEIRVGRAEWLVDANPSIRDAVKEVQEKIEGMSGVHVMSNGNYLGAVGLEDKLRREAPETISKMRKLGVRRIDIFTGDRLAVAMRVGKAVGVDSIEAECLPEEKHAQLDYLVKKGHRTLVVGDGINDGPMLATADVGVAMGMSGSDIATNSAGITLMNDDLRHIPFILELARKNRGIIALNIGFSIVLAIVGLALAATGKINIWYAPGLYVVGYLFVIANSMRLIRFGEGFSEQEHARRRVEEGRIVKPTRASSSKVAQPSLA